MSRYRLVKKQRRVERATDKNLTQYVHGTRVSLRVTNQPMFGTIQGVDSDGDIVVIWDNDPGDRYYYPIGSGSAARLCEVTYV